MSNRKALHEILKGRYGRKVAYANYDKVTEDNVLDILGNTIGVHNANKTAIDYLWNYKNGDQPILYRVKEIRDDIVNKVVENHAYEIVQFFTAQTYGEPLQYVSQTDKEDVNTAVDALNDYMRRAFKYQRNTMQGEWKSAVGTSYLAIQRTSDKELPFRIVVPSPLNTYIVYSSITGEPLMAVQELKDEKNERFYQIYSETHEYKVKNSQLIPYGESANSYTHAYHGIPIVEVPNNQDRLSDIEIVITLLDSVNTMQSNRMDGVEQFIQSWIKFVNCEIDQEQFAEMKMQGALVVSSNQNGGGQADVDVMSTELNQSESQVAKNDLWDNALTILAIPNKESGSGGDTQGAVELRNGWDFAKQRAKLKDAYVKEAEMRFVKVVLEVIRVNGNDDVRLSVSDFEVNIPHSPQDNMSTKANVLVLLLQAGISPQVAIRTCGLWSDSEKVFLESQPYLKNLYKTIDDALDEQIAQMPDAEEQLTLARQLAGNGSGSQIPQNENNSDANTSVLRERLLNGNTNI